MSGDNSNSIFLLTPKTQDPEDWTYATEQLDSFDADVGRPAIGDVDGNGFADVFVPVYDAKRVAHYEFRAAARGGFEVLV